MPRQARIDAPGALHHIIGRGLERRAIFRDDVDRDDFLTRLERVITETQTRCHAWALMPNHFHLLLKTGDESIATVMRRLLTGYAGRFNRRHRRSGHLFQNRYKSILCQEEVYLLELVRYIHLNPLRAGTVKSLDELDRYPYCGHACLLGKAHHDWQETESVLGFFGNDLSSARQRYRAYVEKGMGQGRRPDLTGGGLVRSVGGWQSLEAIRKAGVHQKSDERMLGDGNFVHTVLSRAKERLQWKYDLVAKGIGFEQLLQWVSALTGIPVEAMVGPGKERRTVRARSLLCFWAVRELGIPLTDVARRLRISVPTVSIAVRRGMRIAEDERLEFSSLINK